MDEQEIDDLRDDMNEDEMEILQREEEFAHHPHQSTQPEDNVDFPALMDPEDDDPNDEEELDDLELDNEYDDLEEDDSEIKNENDAVFENENQNNVELTGVEGLLGQDNP